MKHLGVQGDRDVKTIVFLGVNKSGSSREAIRAAERLGYYTVLLTDRRKIIQQRLEFPDVHKMIECDLADEEEIVRKIEHLQEHGFQIALVTSFVEPNVGLAAKIAAQFCDQRLSLDAICRMEDKINTRKALRKTVYNPYYLIFDRHDDIEDCVDDHDDHLPLIIKAPQSTGSRHVLQVRTRSEMREALHMLRDRFPDDELLIEQFLEGPQYLVEVLVVEGKAHPIAIIEQEITKGKRFIVTGYAVRAELKQAFREQIVKAVSDIVGALGMKTGACHLEMRLVDGQWKLIEINPRISGSAMNRMIEIACGLSLVEQTLLLQLGEETNLTKPFEREVFTQFITVEETGVLARVSGRVRASQMDGVEEVFVKPRNGQKLTPPVSMGQRYAYVIAAGDTQSEARRNAKAAAEKIQFHLNSTKR